MTETVKNIKAGEAYKQLVGPDDNGVFKSRANKRQLCERLETVLDDDWHDRGFDIMLGECNGNTVKTIKQSDEYAHAPVRLVNGGKTKSRMNKAELCELIDAQIIERLGHMSDEYGVVVDESDHHHHHVSAPGSAHEPPEAKEEKEEKEREEKEPAVANVFNNPASGEHFELTLVCGDGKTVVEPIPNDIVGATPGSEIVFRRHGDRPEYLVPSNLTSVSTGNDYVRQPGTLAAGGNGAVIEYRLSTDPTRRLLLKIGKVKDDVAALNVLRLHDTFCGSVESKIIKVKLGDRTETAIVMPMLAGTLDKILDLPYMTPVLRNTIAQTILNQILCLAEYGLFYIDLKVENIMFSCNETNRIGINLIDIGSAITPGDRRYVSLTIQPPELPGGRCPRDPITNVRSMSANQLEKATVWVLAIVMYLVAGHGYNRVFGFRNFSYSETIARIKRNDPAFFNVFKLAFAKNPDHRYGLEELTHIIRAHFS
jgi:serine/threonine protein kinase